tara:strand:- start:293 stop:442 length:150 start_codon:yes stop_codon:yes gene_type:complete
MVKKKKKTPEDLLKKRKKNRGKATRLRRPGLSIGGRREHNRPPVYGHTK